MYQRFLRTTVKARLSFIQSLLSPFHRRTLNVDLLKYVANVVASLPFEKEEEPLSAIFYIERAVASSHT